MSEGISPLAERKTDMTKTIETSRSNEAAKESFAGWMESVNARLSAGIGLTSDDLPDICYRDLYETGSSPGSAARIALNNARSEME